MSAPHDQNELMVVAVASCNSKFGQPICVWVLKYNIIISNTIHAQMLNPIQAHPSFYYYNIPTNKNPWSLRQQPANLT